MLNVLLSKLKFWENICKIYGPWKNREFVNNYIHHSLISQSMKTKKHVSLTITVMKFHLWYFILEKIWKNLDGVSIKSTCWLKSLNKYSINWKNRNGTNFNGVEQIIDYRYLNEYLMDWVEQMFEYFQKYSQSMFVDSFSVQEQTWTGRC